MPPAVPMPSSEPIAPTGEVAALVTRGVRRALAALGHATVVEFPLQCGRRADIVAVDGRGAILIIEVKSGPADFRSDHKWPDYELYCDRFYFAVAGDFPRTLIPESCGLIVADGYDAAFLREPAEHRLNAARRKAMLLRFGLAAAQRLHRLEDPGLAGWAAV